MGVAVQYTTMSLARDDRAQAIGIVRYLASLGVGAILIWLLSEVTSPLFEHVNGQTDPNTAGATGTIYLEQLVGAAPIVFLLVGFFGLIAYSVYTRVMLR